MGFIYGLAVVLVIFEGIIIQCEGGCAFSSNQEKENAPINDIQCEGAENPNSSNRIGDAQNIDTDVDLPILPNDVIELIVSKTDFKTIHEAIRSYIVPPNGIVMSRILQDHIIFIQPERDVKIGGCYHLGHSFMTISNYEALSSFFEKFGDQVKQIAIYLGKNDGPRREITQNIIKRYANKFEELIIEGFHFDRFWNGISDGENDIIFPEVKRFQMKGDIHRNDFKLNLIFPKLESFSLVGNVADVNCLENVKGLKEVKLETSSIQEDQFDGIFANNKNMTMVFIRKPERIETMRSIAKHLTKLKTLEVRSPGENFLLRANNSPVCKLPSVVTFSCFSFALMGEAFVIGNLSFDMPHLKNLTLEGLQADDRIINFIQHFKELEILKLSFRNYNAINLIEKLKNIKEFTIYSFQNEFDSLKNIFKNFDKTSKLQTVKFFIVFDETLYKTYEDSMKELNIDLKNSLKPIWSLSHGKEIKTNQKYMIFSREPCTFKSCEE